MRLRVFVLIYPFPINFLLVVVLPEVVCFGMVSRLLIGDNNLSRFWPAYQFSRPALKTTQVFTATDLDTLDHGLSQIDEKDVVIVSVLTSILIEEVNQLEVESSASNVCDQAVSRLLGLCPRTPGCQV